MTSYDFLYYVLVSVVFMKRYQHHNPLIPFHPSPSTLVHCSPPCYFTSLFALSLLVSHILDVTLNESSRVGGRTCTFGCSDSDRSIHFHCYASSSRELNHADMVSVSRQRPRIVGCLPACSKSMLQRCHLSDCQSRPKGEISADD